MALKATVYKASLNVADMSRNIYLDHSVTLAQHPSETIQRMMLRLLAWTLYADQKLLFAKNLCDSIDPELCIKNYNGEIELWIEFGLPDEKRLKKACSLSRHVVLFAYNDNAALVWKSQMLNKLHPFKNLSVIYITDNILNALANVASRTMTIQATIEDGQIWFSVGDKVLSIEPEQWKLAQHF